MTWETNALWNKSKLYIDRALKEDRQGDLFPFWLSLASELLARSALSKIHPLLLADVRDDGNNTNILHALGRPAGKAKPKSLAISSVLKLCRQLVPEFTDDNLKILSALADMRNEELHSGALAFANLNQSTWLTKYYKAIQILCASVGEDLDSFLGVEEAFAAQEMLAADLASVHDRVLRLIGEHKAAFAKLAPEAQAHRSRDSSARAIMMSWNGGHRVTCPSCGSITFVRGEPYSQKPPALEDGRIVIRETIVPTRLECTACGLKLESHAEVAEAGLGNQYTRTMRHDPLEYYADGESDWAEYDNE